VSQSYNVILKIYNNTKFWEATVSSVTPISNTCTATTYNIIVLLKAKN